MAPASKVRAVTPAHTIPRLPAAAPELSFDALRLQGIRAAQGLSGERWTDYNLHDPGVTLLEAVTYALTELAYRAELPLADHLCDERGHIPWQALGLPLPDTAFPCRPTTTTDYRRALLDALPELDGATMVPMAWPQPATGLYSLVLDAPAGADRAALEPRARAAYAGLRNLCEDLDSVTWVDKRECTLHAEIEIGGASDPADIVAGVYDRCASYLAAAVEFESCAQALPRVHTPDRLLTGPRTANGIARGESLARAGQADVFITDLIACARNPDVKDVHWLALQVGDGVAATSSLPWRDASGSWVLALRPPQGSDSVDGLTVRRNGNLISVRAREVRRRYDDLRTARLARRHGLDDFDLVCPPPQGRPVHDLPYYSVQNHFPAVYGLGEHGLPESASDAERARVHQLQAYLLLFEQLLAHGGAQVQHLRELFSIEGAAAATRWWHVLRAGEVPGIAGDAVGNAAAESDAHRPGLWLSPPEHIEQQVCAPFDDRIDRRHRVLDYLLSLQGQTYAQNSLRQFSDHLTPAEMDSFLLKNKVDFARALETLSPGRAGGFNPAAASWGVAGNSAGLQRHISLLLGFAHEHSRGLAAGLGKWQAVSADEFLAHEPDAANAARRVDRSPAMQRLDLGSPHARRTAEQRHDERQRLAITRCQRIPAALMRCGARHDRYLWQPIGGGGHGGRGRLVVGPDENREYWQVAEWQGLDRTAALQHAGSLRCLLRQIDQRCEGLHVVEHLLLRPHAGWPDDAQAAAFFALRLSVVFPDWTTRSQRRNFRHFAQDTVRINCPAHLDARCLWLSPVAMAAFEAAYKTWLDHRCPPPGVAEPVSSAVDAAAAELVRLLSTGWP
jgi:hypothetical protein